MSEPKVVHEQKSVFFTVKRAMIVGAVVLGVFGALTGDAKWESNPKEITRLIPSEVLAGCIVSNSYTGQSGEILGSTTRLSVEECEKERSFNPDAPLQNIYKTENVEKKVVEPVRGRDFGGEAMSRGLRFVIGAAFGTLLAYGLSVRSGLKNRILSVRSRITFTRTSPVQDLSQATSSQSRKGELNWITRFGYWKFIPDRYQALVACIVSAFLYFNVLKTIFGIQDFNVGSCGSLFRPVISDDQWGNPGWFWNLGNAQCDRMMSGRLWELFFTFVGLAICGVVLRRSITANN